MREHDSEIRQFHAVRRKLDAARAKGEVMKLNEWQKEKEELQKECAAESSEASALYQELKYFYTIMSRINDRGVKKANSKAQEIE